VGELGRADTLRVVDASLTPPAWVAAEAHEEKAQQIKQLVGDYGKLVEDGELADGVFVVEGERFPLHRNVLAARSEYCRARFKSGMQDGGSKEVCHEYVSASAFRVLLRFPYAGALPAWDVGGGGEGGGGAEGRVGRQGELVGARVAGSRAREARAKKAQAAKSARAARGPGRPLRKRTRTRKRGRGRA
jgi:hypothetical protein